MRNILLICFLVILGHAYSQKSEQGFIKDIKFNYVKGDFNSAKEGLEKALIEYPSSRQLLTLKSLIEAEGYAVVLPKSVTPLPKSPKQIPGGNIPKGGVVTPHQPRENPDTDNDGFIGSQDKCPSESGDINGCPDSDGDKVPDYRDNCPDAPGVGSKNGCPIPKSTTISVDLQMASQNLFSWNSALANEGMKTTIIFETKSGATFQKDVSNVSSFKFKPGDTRFDGVFTNVKLIIETRQGVKIIGTKEIKVKTTC